MHRFARKRSLWAWCREAAFLLGLREDFYKAAMGAGFVVAVGARSLKFSAGDRYTRGRIRQPASGGLLHLSRQPLPRLERRTQVRRAKWHALAHVLQKDMD